jgi:hypothetical protein
MDEVAIYNHALTPQEIQKHYNDGLAGIELTPDTNTLGLWHFDEGTGTVTADSSSYDNVGTLEPFGPTWTSGQIVDALKFDGAYDYIDCGNDLSLKPSTALSLEAWVNFDSETGDAMIIGDYDWQNRRRSYYLGRYGNINRLMFGVSQTGSDYYIIYYDTLLSADTWYHVTGTFDGSNQESKLYIDGIEVPTTVWAGSPKSSLYTSNSPIYIGKRHDNKWFFDGAIDEVAIHDRTLTAGEILQHYNDGLAGIEITPDSNTQGLWHFDDGSGTIAIDSSANDNDGVLHPSGPLWTTGQIGDALKFDGVNDYVDCGDDMSLKPKTALSIESWVKFDSPTGDAMIISDHHWQVNKRSYFLGRMGSLTNRLLFGISSNGADRYQVYYDSLLSADTWYHIAATFSGETQELKIYIDGSEVPTVVRTGSPLSSLYTSPNHIFIGKGFDNKWRLKNLINEVALYDRTLSASEIQQHYNDGLVGTPISVTLGVDWYPLMNPNPNTPSGTDVGVSAGDGVEMQFSNVITPGFTYAEQVTGTPPANFKLVPVKTFYDISTTATFSGTIAISIPYDDTGIKPQKENTLKLMHWDEVLGIWVDITTSVDTVNNIIYGETTSLSIFAIMYENKPPVVIITGPEAGSLYIVGSSVEFTGIFTDLDTEDTHTAEWTFTSQGMPITIDGSVVEGGGSGTVTGLYTFTETGVYLVKLTVWDNDEGEGTSEHVGDLVAMVVIYDPEGGFVTGGGWIDSPLGAYELDPLLTGKASFGFVAKYKKGASIPMGNTEFKFEIANLDFHSSNYEWLVVAGDRAQFKGTGTINDEGLYKFKIWATDGDLSGTTSADMFRIKIWEEDDLGIETVIYDNKVDTELGGGQIKIHKG